MGRNLRTHQASGALRGVRIVEQLDRLIGGHCDAQQLMYDVIGGKQLLRNGQSARWSIQAASVAPGESLQL